MVEMEVAGVAQLPNGADIAILQERGGDRSLGIGIAKTTAAAIGVHIAGVELPRPGTYVLTVRVLADLGAAVVRAVLDDDEGGEPAAFLEVGSPLGVMELPCAAEDAIAVAAHADAPVLVHPGLFTRTEADSAES